ncbi:DEAD/DEAH box helicase family protein [Allofustis seminis]|uniref:DEAD/DEAH box helicase family protein n=1 Tax=Allofustis seminis TaxID=166939 RepID=UPI000365DCCB|nr:DEAD/DEAH box helicase family protein [Allofustis seminis]
MESNFSFLNKEKMYHSFASACSEAERLMNVSYSAAAAYTRRAAELAVKWMYANDKDLNLPYNDNFAALINDFDFKDIVGLEMYRAIDFIRVLGNKAAHTNMAVTRSQAVLSLRNLFNFTDAIDMWYSKEYEEKSFNESLLGDNDKLSKTQKEKEELLEIISLKDKNLEQIIEENKKLREENQAHRIQNEHQRPFNFETISEKETREQYIDLDLEMKGWKFEHDFFKEVKVSHTPNTSKAGYADYVLYSDNGKPLAVLEAKRTSKSPIIGKHQVRLYADALEKETGVRPVMFYTNGIKYYIWDDESTPEREVSGIYSKEDLETLFFKRENKISMENATADPNIAGRYYQIEAVRRVLENIEKGARKSLLVMATGSGKTRTAAAIVDILTRHNYAKNILFLADRTALVKQAKESFASLLPNMSLCNLLDGKDDVNSKMVFSTYPTIMNAIDEKLNDDEDRVFTTGHFDLIILDESHRSIYKKYQAIFEYFDASLLGLTATPVNEIDRNTYRIFDIEDSNPTYAYELEEAIDDGFLVPYELPTVSVSQFTRKGIVYDKLSEEEKEEFEETFESCEDIPSTKINRSLFNTSTVDMILKELMEKGLKVSGGDFLGKTIIFAANRAHADFIVERFNALFPEYKGEFAVAIYHSINYVDDLIDRFKNSNSKLHIAASVDMLDTGIDVPEILNLVFFKEVKSKTKFWQMIGRGTRLCKDIFGPGLDKTKFYIFDYYQNFKFFQANKKEASTPIAKSLTENLFGVKLDIIKALQPVDFEEEAYVKYREELIENILREINAISRNRFDSMMKIHLLDKYGDKRSYECLDEKNLDELKKEIAPLIISTDRDEMAKSFDYLMYTIILGTLLGKQVTNPINKVVTIANLLFEKFSIDQVKKQKELITKATRSEFWNEGNIFDFEMVRVALRDLVKLLEKETRQLYYTSFSDKTMGIEEVEGHYKINDLSAYKKKVEEYFKKYKDNLPIYKLRNNKKLTKSDLKYFEKILFEELGNKETFEMAYGEGPLMNLVAKIAGMDREATIAEFSKFLNDKSLNADQINFVNKIVSYLIENGSLDKKVLADFPFAKAGGIVTIFENKVDVAKNIVETIDEINSRLVI